MALRALILTAGLGTRLRPLTCVRAKAAVPVNGEAMARRVIAWLVAQGIDDLVLNLHHRPDSIGAVVGDGGDLGARVRYSWENPVLGSAGGPRRALPLLVDGAPADDQRFLIVNGDTLTDLRVARLLEVHRASGAMVTMAVVPNPRPDAYGGVLVEDGRVIGFSGRGQAPPGGAASFHFIGAQVCEAHAFSRLADGVPAESVMALYPEIMREDRSAIAACVVDAAFHDIGAPADYLDTSLALAAIEGDRLADGSMHKIHATADLRRTAVWDGVTIGANSRLDECIVCDGAQIPEGSRYRRCAIAPYRGEGLQGREWVDGNLLVTNF